MPAPFAEPADPVPAIVDKTNNHITIKTIIIGTISNRSSTTFRAPQFLNSLTVSKKSANSGNKSVPKKYAVINAYKNKKIIKLGYIGINSII